jgi:hypothetical protein
MTAASGLPLSVIACLWSGLVSLGLLLGAFAGLYAPLKHRGITSVMAGGAGILIAAASRDLIVAAVTEVGAIPAGVRTDHWRRRILDSQLLVGQARRQASQAMRRVRAAADGESRAW